MHDYKRLFYGKLFIFIGQCIELHKIYIKYIFNNVWKVIRTYLNKQDLITKFSIKWSFNVDSKRYDISVSITFDFFCCNKVTQSVHQKTMSPADVFVKLLPYKN